MLSDPNAILVECTRRILLFASTTNFFDFSKLHSLWKPYQVNLQICSFISISVDWSPSSTQNFAH